MADQYYNPNGDLQEPYQQAPYQPDPYQQPYQPVYQQPAMEQPNLLVFGILSLALGPIIAIILGAIGRKKGNEYIAAGGTLTGTSKVGYILCKVGVILGIVGAVVLAIYAVLLGVGIAAGAFN